MAPKTATVLGHAFAHRDDLARGWVEHEARSTSSMAPALSFHASASSAECRRTQGTFRDVAAQPH